MRNVTTETIEHMLDMWKFYFNRISAVNSALFDELQNIECGEERNTAETMFWKIDFALDVARERIAGLSEELKLSEQQDERLERAFSAWCWGLCPKAVMENPDAFTRYFAGGESCEAYPEIAALLHSKKRFSYSDTMRALNLWLSQKWRLSS